MINPKFKHPCRTLIVGKSGSGKTTLAMNYIRPYVRKFHSVVLISPSHKTQDNYRILHATGRCRSYPLLTTGILASLTSEQGRNCKRRRMLIIIDDQSGTALLNGRGKGHLANIACNALWMNISFVVMSHTVNSVDLQIRQNIETVFFYHTHRFTELQMLHREFFGNYSYEFFISDIISKLSADHDYFGRSLNGQQRTILYKNGTLPMQFTEHTPHRQSIFHRWPAPLVDRSAAYPVEDKKTQSKCDGRVVIT